ncbi:MAG: T9SS type A sorting domain-containing protein [Bacteroidia bacterium]|nr:T9SS type A sorting domain-containing protein [Bacteroidia bacterium]
MLQKLNLIRKSLFILLALVLPSLISAQITVNSVIPNPACVGAPFSVSGTGLNTATSVTVGGHAATILGATSQQLIAEIPSAINSTGAYTVVVSNGNSSGSATVNVEYLDPWFSYQPSYCSDSTLILPDSVTTAGGVFSGNSVPNLNSQTGEFASNYTTWGIVTVTYTTTTAAGCQYSQSQSIDLLNANIPQIMFLKDQYCQNAPDDKPLIIWGDSTGFFTFHYLNSGGGALSYLSPYVGLIDFSNSTPGIYEILYSLPGQCPRSARDTIEILQAHPGVFSYPQTVYCINDPNPIPLIKGFTPGIFTEQTGSVVFVNDTTGEIDLSASGTGGPFIITYQPEGPCAETYTFNLIIQQCPLGLEEGRGEGAMQVYPNPANGQVWVEFTSTPTENYSLSLSRPDGKTVWARHDLRSGRQEISLTDLSAGIYFLTFQNRQGQEVHKIIKSN